jgi:hypothetical protein
MPVPGAGVMTGIVGVAAAKRGRGSATPKASGAEHTGHAQAGAVGWPVRS